MENDLNTQRIISEIHGVKKALKFLLTEKMRHDIEERRINIESLTSASVPRQAVTEAVKYATERIHKKYEPIFEGLK